MNRALNLVPKRAESRQTDELRETFVDSGIAVALEAVDHQILYGRRGTGKTHALRYLETQVQAKGDIAFYADLRTIGSPEGLFMGEGIPATERAARLLIDLLSQLHDAILQATIDDEELIADGSFISQIDALADAITRVRIAGNVERAVETQTREAEGFTAEAGMTLGSSPSIGLKGGSEDRSERQESIREQSTGAELIQLNFTEVAKALRELAGALAARRIWIVLDEWSSVPLDTQPYLAEFVVRCVLPLQQFTVKIAAIEQQTRFRAELDDGQTIGIELGADVAANVNLDEFMVFEQNEERAREFFRGLLFKHLTRGVDEDQRVPGLQRENDVVKLGFTERRAFDELVRAAEGVPRDAINIAAKAALQARDRPIAVPDIRKAALGWYQADKAAAVAARDEAQRLLNWIVDKVIKQKRARGFLVNQRSAGAPLLTALFDARVLHLIRRGYSGQDEPGERYDVYVIDYGAYVDLINTKNEPQGTLPLDEAVAGDAYTDVPTQDLRAIRRAILDLDEFAASAST